MNDLRAELRTRTASNFGDDTRSRRRSFGIGGRQRLKIFAGLGLAVVSSIGAAMVASQWVEAQASRMAAVAAPPPVVVEAPKQTIVVAARRLTYGSEVTPAVLKEIEWIADELPSGAFTSADAVLDDGGKRFALVDIEANEPVLAPKLSGATNSFTLASRVAAGYKAITIRVDDVLGVAGLIMPGDRVDVLWTRTEGAGQDPDSDYSEILLQNVQVLAIDQQTEEKNSVPGVARAVTLEVDTLQTQRVALAASLGKLYLALRGEGYAAVEATRRVTVSDLSRPTFFSTTGSASMMASLPRHVGAIGRDGGSATGAEAPVVGWAEAPRFVVVGVTRGVNRKEYNVISERALY